MLCAERKVPSPVKARQKGKQHTMMLSSSFAAGLRPLGRPLFSAIDMSEGVVALELAWDTLLEGAMRPDAGGVHPQPRAKRKLILMVQRGVQEYLRWLKLI